MKIAFLMNPSAHWGFAVAQVVRQIKQADFEAKFFNVDRAQTDSTERHCAAILRENFERLVVVGGDGSLNRVINDLHKQNALERVALGLLPFGTCNDFSKILGFGKGCCRQQKIVEALKAFGGNSFRQFRVAKVNGHCFLNNAGFGRRNPVARKSSPLADLWRMKPVDTDIDLDEQSFLGSFLMMLCANAPYFSNGLHFDKKSDPSDDLLEFFFVKKISKMRLFAKFFLGKFGRPLAGVDVATVQAASLVVQTQDPVWIMADGEIVPELCSIRRATFELEGHCRFMASESMILNRSVGAGL